MEGAWKPVYTADISERLAYVAELKYTYSKPNLVVSTSVKNIHQDLPGVDRDNTLGIGTTAFWHKGILRLTAGFNYFWEKAEVFETDIKPQERLRNTATLRFSSWLPSFRCLRAAPCIEHDMVYPQAYHHAKLYSCQPIC